MDNDADYVNSRHWKWARVTDAGDGQDDKDNMCGKVKHNADAMSR